MRCFKTIKSTFINSPFGNTIGIPKPIVHRVTEYILKAREIRKVITMPTSSVFSYTSHTKRVYDNPNRSVEKTRGSAILKSKYLVSIIFFFITIGFFQLEARVTNTIFNDKEVVLKSNAVLNNGSLNLLWAYKRLVTAHPIFPGHTKATELGLNEITTALKKKIVAEKQWQNENQIGKKRDEGIRTYVEEGVKSSFSFLFFMLVAVLTNLFFYFRFYQRQKYSTPKNSPTTFIPEIEFPKNDVPSDTKLNLELNKVNASWERLFSIIAHDLKSPFNVLLNYTDILIDDFDSMKRKDIKKHLHTLHRSAHKNYQLTQNLLSWAMLQRGGVKINKQEISIKQLIDESTYMCSEVAEQKAIKVVNRCATNLTGKVDKDVAISILLNLVSNALKFTPKNGIVTINVKKLNSNILIKVDDNGVGISNDISKNLYKLNRIKSSKGTANEKGTGLGLILCKELIQLHNGMIKIKSRLGKGTTVLALF